MDNTENTQFFTLTLNEAQVNAVLGSLGNLPTNSGVWPLIQVILQQVQSQLPEKTEESTEPTE